MKHAHWLKLGLDLPFLALQQQLSPLTGERLSRQFRWGVARDLSITTTLFTAGEVE